jgi:SET domain-containing protein 6
MDELDLLEDGYNIPRSDDGESLANFIPDELLALIQAFQLSPEQLDQARTKQKPPKPILGVAGANLLLQVAQKTLAQYAISVAQDDEILHQLDQKTQNWSREEFDASYRRLLMAVEVRKGEKEILSQLSTKLEQYIAENQDITMGDSQGKRNAQNGNEAQSNPKRYRRE